MINGYSTRIVIMNKFYFGINTDIDKKKSALFRNIQLESHFYMYNDFFAE